MILADDVLAWMGSARKTYDLANREQADRIEFAIIQAQRFRLSPSVQELVDQLRQRPAALLASRATMFLPAPMTWIEWADEKGISSVRCGFLLLGRDDDLHAGAALIVHNASPSKVLLPISCRFQLTDPQLPTVSPVWGGEDILRQIEDRYRIKTGEISRTNPKMYEEFGVTLLAILALINAPKVATTRPGDDLTRLNLKRRKKGRTPLLTWRTVIINVDAPDVRTAYHPGDTGKMPLHFVRSYLQRNHGEWRLVRAHWRGDAEHGRILKNYRAVRDGEIRTSSTL